MVKEGPSCSERQSHDVGAKGHSVKSLFISHAVKDKLLVDAFIELLEGGIGIGKDAIFCSSSEGQGIPSGEDFAPYMRERLQKAALVIALVSENYYDSPFCLCETGGTWYGEKPFIPLLTPPVSYSDLRGALYGKQAILLDSSKGLNEMYDQARKKLEVKDHGVARWELRRDQFLKKVPELSKAIGKPAGLKAIEAEALIRERDALKAEYASLDGELQSARKQIKALEGAKSATDVKRIKREFSGEEETFASLVLGARSELRKLPSIVRLAAYYHYRDEALPLEETAGRDCDSAIEEKFLTSDSDHGVELFSDHPKVRKAIAALDELRSFMNDVDDNSESTFRDDYEERTEDVFDLGNRNFWRDNDLL